MEIRIPGTGCPECKRLEELNHEAVEETGIEATVTKGTDVSAIMAAPIVSTPGLAIDEDVKSPGRLPQEAEIVRWTQETRR